MHTGNHARLKPVFPSPLKETEKINRWSIHTSYIHTLLLFRAAQGQFQPYLQSILQTRNCKLKGILRSAGSPAVVARPTYEPAADGDQASCVTTTRTAERQEVVHAVPPTAFKTAHSEYCNITKTRTWETRQRKTSQRRTAKASKPEVRPRWNEALTKTRGKGLWVLRVAVGGRTNLSSRRKEEENILVYVNKNIQKKCIVQRRCAFDLRKINFKCSHIQQLVTTYFGKPLPVYTIILTAQGRRRQTKREYEQCPNWNENLKQ